MAKGPVYKLMVYMSKHMIGCDEASFLVSLHEDQPLGFRQWWQLKIHLLSCHLCRKYAHQIRQLNHSMEVYRHQCNDEKCAHHLPPETGSRIEHLVERDLNVK